MAGNAQRAVLAAVALVALWVPRALAQQGEPAPEQAPSPAPPPGMEADPSSAPETGAPEGAPRDAPEVPGAPDSPSAAPPPPEPPMQSLMQAITLTPGASCLEHERLVKRVARWLERDTIDPRIHVHVVGEDVTEVRFTIDRGAGEISERTLEDAPEDCGQLHATVALSIALAIDATRPGAPPVALDLPDDDDLLAPPLEPGYLRGAVAASLEAGSGVLTDVSAGGALRVELGLLRWLDLRAGLFGTAVGEQSVGSTPGHFDVDLVAVRADACPVTAPAPRFRVAACFGAAIGRFRTVGKGFATSFTETRRWTALMGSVEAQLEFASWLAVAVHVDMAVPLDQRTIRVLAPDGQVVDALEPPVAGMIVGFGPIFRLF